MAASLPSLSKTFSQAAQEQSVVQYLCPRKQSQYNLMHFDWRHIHPVEVRFLLPDTATLSPASTTVLLVAVRGLLFELLLLEVWETDGAVLNSGLRSMLCPSGDEIA